MDMSGTRSPFSSFGRNGSDPYTEKDHAQPQDNSVLKCFCCGGSMVQHLAVNDGWKGTVGPNGGLVWVCTRDVCKETARSKGVVVPR
jgi:hypothetical protein